MKVKLLVFSLLTIPGFLHAQHNLIISSGTSFRATGGNVVLNNTSITNNGVFNANAAVVNLSGNAASTISGSNAFSMQVLQINKTGGTNVIATVGFSVSSSINMQTGILQMNNANITLPAGATIVNETETSRIITENAGAVVSQPGVLNAPAQVNAGNLGAVITSNQNMGTTFINRRSRVAVNPTNNTLTGIQRTYLIQPANNTALNATLRFYYLDAELNGKDESTLELWKSNDGVNWIYIGYDTRNAALNYVEKIGLADFSFWTLSDAANALPVTISGFSAVCRGNSALIQWRTLAELNTASFIIEKSMDANTWTALQTVNAANAATGSSYKIIDSNPSDKAFYRIKIIGKDGSTAYSPVFSGGCNDVAMPLVVYPNPAVTQATVKCSVRANTTSNIMLYDATGKAVYQSKWSLQPGTNQLIIPVTKLAKGTYTVKLTAATFTQQAQLVKQ